MLAERTGSKHVGLVPDFGIFQHSPSPVAIAYVKRHAAIPEAVDFILANSRVVMKMADDNDLPLFPILINHNRNQDNYPHRHCLPVR